MNNIPGHVILFLMALFASSQTLAVTPAGDIKGTLKNISKYSQGIKLDANYMEVKRAMGKPIQEKPLPSNKSILTAVWKLDSYSVDVKVNNNKVESYGIHWFGLPGKIPAFKDIYSGNFESENRKGSDISRQKNKDVIICWTGKPVPGRKEVISVLDVSKNNNQAGCKFSEELKK